MASRPLRNILQKILQNFTKMLRRISEIFAKFCRILCRIVQNCVDFEKCWKMLYWMQKFMKILLKFNENLTKFYHHNYFLQKGDRGASMTTTSCARPALRLTKCEDSASRSMIWSGLPGRFRPRHSTLPEARSRLDRCRFLQPYTHFAAFSRSTKLSG